MPVRILTIRFDTPLHHGNGFGMAGIIDRPFLQDHARQPYLAGSAVKGKFRSAARRIVGTLGQDRMCGQIAGQYCKPDDPCILCRMFGSPWKEGALVFSDGAPLPEQRKVLEHSGGDNRRALGTTVRSTTAIHRGLRVAKPGHLFTTEIAPALTFQGRIEGDLSEEEELLLRQCAQVLTHFGADSSRGLGQCHYSIRQETT